MDRWREPLTADQNPWVGELWSVNEGLLPADAMRGVFALGPGEDFDKDVFTERKKSLIDRAQLQELLTDS